MPRSRARVVGNSLGTNLAAPHYIHRIPPTRSLPRAPHHVVEKRAALRRLVPDVRPRSCHRDDHRCGHTRRVHRRPEARLVYRFRFVPPSLSPSRPPLLTRCSPAWRLPHLAPSVHSGHIHAHAPAPRSSATAARDPHQRDVRPRMHARPGHHHTDAHQARARIQLHPGAAHAGIAATSRGNAGLRRPPRAAARADAAYRSANGARARD